MAAGTLGFLLMVAVKAKQLKKSDCLLHLKVVRGMLPTICKLIEEIPT
jgi:hypothetical protein